MASEQTSRTQRWIAAGIAFHREGNLADAERLYRRALRRDERNPDAWNYLGVLAHQRGDSAQATQSIRRALELAPDYSDAHNNLGRILDETGDTDGAMREFKEAIRLKCGGAAVHYNLATCLLKRDDAEEAIVELERAIELDGGNADAFLKLGMANLAAARPQPGSVAVERALELDPSLTKAHEILGTLYYAAGRIDDAAKTYDRWLALDPTSAKAAHLRAACGKGDVPDKASAKFVVELFDSFADTFDENLADLDYQAPALVSGAVAALGLKPAGADILDAGCGTGLCGPLLQAHARSLIGVDLSSGMIAAARERDVYDDLVVSDLVDYMSARESSVDLIVAADTINYFGALEGVMSAAAHCLRPGGSFVFTLESMTDESRDFTLNPHGRYSHSRAYAERAARNAGLAIGAPEAVVLRQEIRRPVEGLVFVAHREGFTLAEPLSTNELEEYFELRWRILRAPWNQPRGSERDEFDGSGHHVCARDSAGKLIGVGRVHQKSPSEARIRYMATKESCRGRGVGRAIADRLEWIAAKRGASKITMNARTPAVPFYERLGYRIVGEGPTLFGEIAHKRMEKHLTSTEARRS